MDAVDVLMEARAYIEKGWVQRRMGERDDGRQSHPCKEWASAWCAVGALSRPLEQYAFQRPEGNAAIALLVDANRISRKGTRREWEGVRVVDVPVTLSPRRALENWNDAEGRTQAEVLEAFDRAIELGLDRISQ